MKQLLLLPILVITITWCSLLWWDDRATSWLTPSQDDIKADPMRILALWDSLTAWYWVPESDNYPSKLWDLLSEKWYNYKIVNAWVSWDTSGELLERANLYLDQDPDIVLLVIWGNDGLQSKSVEDMKSNIIEIIDLYDNWERKIVLWWMQIPINLWLSYSRDFKSAYKEIYKQRKNIYLLDYFLEWVWWYTRYNISDRIHPNTAWYDIIVANMFEFLKDEKIITK